MTQSTCILALLALVATTVTPVLAARHSRKDTTDSTVAKQDVSTHSEVLQDDSTFKVDGFAGHGDQDTPGSVEDPSGRVAFAMSILPKPPSQGPENGRRPPTSWLNPPQMSLNGRKGFPIKWPFQWPGQQPKPETPALAAEVGVADSQNHADAEVNSPEATAAEESAERLKMVRHELQVFSNNVVEKVVDLKKRKEEADTREDLKESQSLINQLDSKQTVFSRIQAQLTVVKDTLKDLQALRKEFAEKSIALHAKSIEVESAKENLQSMEQALATDVRWLDDASQSGIAGMYQESSVSDAMRTVLQALGRERERLSRLEADMGISAVEVHKIKMAMMDVATKAEQLMIDTMNLKWKQDSDTVDMIRVPW